MKKEIIILFILGTIISSIVSVIAASTISSNAVLYKDDRTVNTVLDELFENVDAIESDNTRLTSLEGKVNTLTSTHSSDIARIDNNITSINTKIGSTDISSIGDGTITGAIIELKDNSKLESLQNVLTNNSIVISNFMDYQEIIIKSYFYNGWCNTLHIYPKLDEKIINRSTGDSYLVSSSTTFVSSGYAYSYASINVSTGELLLKNDYVINGTNMNDDNILGYKVFAKK